MCTQCRKTYSLKTSESTIIAKKLRRPKEKSGQHKNPRVPGRDYARPSGPRLYSIHNPCVPCCPPAEARRHNVTKAQQTYGHGRLVKCVRNTSFHILLLCSPVSRAPVHFRHPHHIGDRHACTHTYIYIYIYDVYVHIYIYYI